MGGCMRVFGIDPGLTRCGIAVLVKTNMGAEFLMETVTLDPRAAVEYLEDRHLNKIDYDCDRSIFCIEKPVAFQHAGKEITETAIMAGAFAAMIRKSTPAFLDIYLIPRAKVRGYFQKQFNDYIERINKRKTNDAIIRGALIDCAGFSKTDASKDSWQALALAYLGAHAEDELNKYLFDLVR